MKATFTKTLGQSVITLFFTALIYIYFLWQFPEDRRYTFFFLNKAAGETAVVAISLSYLLGPLCRIIPYLARRLSYRRYFGVAGFLMVILHIIFSLLQWNDRFNFAWYQDHIVGVSFAYAATTIFLVLTIISSNYAIKALSSKTWKWIQRIGYLALIFTTVHIFVASSGRWVMWRAGEVDMPSSFIVFVVAGSTVLIRLIMIVVDLLFPRGGKNKK